MVLVIRLSPAILLAGLSLISSSAFADVQLKGADGISLTLAAPAKRVVNLSPD